MAVLYSLYDALVSINVPNDKARAVVDAMEMDMLAKLATKSDLEHLRLATKSDLEHLRLATTAGLTSMRALLSKDIEAVELRMDKKLSDLGDKLTMRLAGLMAAMIGASTALVGAAVYFH